MQTVGHGAAEQLVTLGGKSRGDHAGLGDIENRIAVRDLVRQLKTRRVGLDLIHWYKKNKVKVRRDVAAKIGAVRPRSGEAPEGGRRCVVGMSLQFGAQQVNLPRLEGSPRQFIESVKEAQAEGDAAA